MLRLFFFLFENFISYRMEKPKIIVLSTAYYPFIGGAEIAIQEITERLKDRFDFYIITSRMRRSLPKREVRSEGTILRIGFGTKFDKWLLPFLGFYKGWTMAVRDRTVFWGVDISQGSLVAALLKIFFPRIPFVFTIQYGYGEERLLSGRGSAIRHAFRLMLSHADYVTAISAYLLDYARQYGYAGSGVVVHNGVDIKKFKNQDSKLLNRQSNIVITTSRLVAKNGVDTLIQAIAIARKDIPDIQCHIVGDGPERKNLEHEVGRLALQKNVTFFGEVPYQEVPQYLHGANIFVRPSRSEGMGNSFVEALAAGLPIIGTPVGGIRDIIEDGKTGLFARADDPEDFAEKIQSLLSHRELAEKIVYAGTRMVEQRFSWDHIANQYGGIFSAVLGAECRLLIATGLFPPEIGGPATYSQILLEELPARNFLVAVLPYRKVRHVPKMFRHFAYFLRVLAKGRAADIIFAQDPVSVGLPAAVAAAFLRKVFIVKIVGDYAWEQAVQRFGTVDLLDDFLGKRFGWRIEVLRKIERWVANRAKKVIVPSRYLKGVVMQWGVRQDNIEVIYNAFDGKVAVSTKEDARKVLGISETIFVSLGRLVPWKGFEVLVEIMPVLREKIPGCQLIILGDGPQREKLKLKVEHAGLRGVVRFVGNVPHDVVRVYLQAADVFLLNTAYEGFSHAILEAMGEGVPIVTTRVCGNPEIIRHGVNGYLVAYNNKEELVRAVLSVMSDEALRSRFKKNGRETIREFTRDKMIMTTVQLLKAP